MEALLSLDHTLFRLINQEWSNGLFDAILPLFRTKSTWFPFYVAGLIVLYVKYRMRGLLMAVLAIACVTVTDQISATFMKPFFERARPCHDAASQVRLLVVCGGGFSFVSSHAANHFGLALLFGATFKQRLPWLFWALLAWASIICYGQVYVGVHYPADVFVGGTIGAAVGLGLAWIAKTYLIKPAS
jgi:undecaprenyl-diphosphatase